MKKLRNISKRLVVRISAVCVLSVLLSSCLKDHTSDIPAPPAALLSVVQASPGQPPLDFSLDGSRLNSGAITFGTILDYSGVYAGKRKYLFSKNGSSTPVLTDTITFKQNVAYSLCLVNNITSPQILLLTDSISQPLAGNAALRFVNLSPDAPAVDLFIKDGAAFVTNKAFKGFSTFNPIPGKNYSFEIRKTGTTTVLATVNNVTINSGFVYTIYLRGLAAATDLTKLRADLIINAHPSN
jgi:hypothetical protein